MKKIALSTFLLILAGAFFWSIPTQSQGAGTAASIYKTLFTGLGTPVDSSVRYCSDCQATTPCSSGGTGAFASRVNGVWNCAAGGAGAPGISCSGCSVDTLTKYNGSALVNSRITDDGSITNIISRTLRLGDPATAFNGSFITLDDAAKTVNLAADDNGTGVYLQMQGGATPSVSLSNGGVGSILDLPASGESRLKGSPTIQLGQAGVANLLVNVSSPTITADSRTGSFRAGDATVAGNGTQLVITDSTNDITVAAAVLSPTSNGVTDLGTTGVGFKQFFLDATLTGGGTTGNQTINKAAWTVNFAAAASSLTVTSNKVSTSSIVICTVQTNDTTLKSVQAVPAAGAVALFGNAAATAETKVGCWVLNR